MGLQKYRDDTAGKKQANGGTPYYTSWMGGPTLALVRECVIENAPFMPVYPKRTVYVRGEADTYFSIPAACVYRRKTITGYITTDDAGEYVFRAHTGQGDFTMTEKTYKVVNGTAYDARTPDDLCAVLETVRATRERCVFVCGDVETGVPWDDTPERGTIGRSTGTYKIPLLIKTRRSMGGGGLLDHCILQVRTTVGGRMIYCRSGSSIRP